MKTMKASSIDLTAVFHQDEKGRGITAYFKEFPNVIAVGNTEDDATIRLVELLQLALKDQAHSAKSIRSKRVRSRTVSFRVK